MSQEFHVVRPALFFAGKIKCAIERLEGFVDKGTIIGAHSMSDKDATSVEEKIVNLVEKHSSTKISKFSNIVADSFQFNFDAWHHVRAFAAYQDYPFTKFLGMGRYPFEKPLRPESVPAIRNSIENRKSSFPQLIFMDDNKGFYFPVPIKIPIQTQWGYLGSSIGLLNEIIKIKKLLETSGYWHADIQEFIERFENACKRSIAENLPIIIDG